MYQSSEVGFIGDLFAVCIRALAVVATNCDSPETKPRIQEERGRFALWGDGFEVYEGELDQMLENSDHLKESTVVLLASIASTLIKRILYPDISHDTKSYPAIKKNIFIIAIFSNLNLRFLDLDSDSEITKSLYGLIEKAEKLVPETINYVDEDDDSDVDLSFTVEELKEFNDCLYDLVPFLETAQINTPDESTDAQLDAQLQMLSKSQISELSSSATLPNLRIEAQSYQRNILDKFPNANLELVGTMAELNWLRHERIRDLSNKDRDTEALDITNAFEHIPAKSEVDTSTIPTSFQPSSVFSKAQSCSSIGTSLYEFNQSNIASTGHVRYPNPPLGLGSGKAFVCTICFQPLKNIHNKGQWRAHVIKDLQPYSCTFASCPAKNETFGTRRLWINHEFENHRFIIEWICIKDCGKVFDKKEHFATHIQNDHLSGKTGTLAATELETTISRCEQRRVPPKSSTITCPLCQEEVEETRIALHTHLGIHMEEIALTALPQNLWEADIEDYKDDDDEEESVQSQGDSDSAEEPYNKIWEDGKLDLGALRTETGAKKRPDQSLPPAPNHVHWICCRCGETNRSWNLYNLCTQPRCIHTRCSPGCKTAPPPSIPTLGKKRNPPEGNQTIKVEERDTLASNTPESIPPPHNETDPGNKSLKKPYRKIENLALHRPPSGQQEPTWTEIGRDIAACRAVEAMGYNYQLRKSHIRILQDLNNVQVHELIELSEKIRGRSALRSDSGKEYPELLSPKRHDHDTTAFSTVGQQDKQNTPQGTKISCDIVARRAAMVLGYDFEEQKDHIIISQALDEVEIGELIELSEKIRSGALRVTVGVDYGGRSP